MDHPVSCSPLRRRGPAINLFLLILVIVVLCIVEVNAIARFLSLLLLGTVVLFALGHRIMPLIIARLESDDSNWFDVTDTIYTCGDMATGILRAPWVRSTSLPAAGGTRMSVLGHRLAIEEGIMLSRTQVERLHLLLRDGDFTGDDYEMLRALDDDVISPSVGLSKAELDLLPIHIYKASDAAKSGVKNKTEGDMSCCPICLDSFLQGEEIRILPCLHQIHSAGCGDPWLLMRGSCPVCKKGAF